MPYRSLILFLFFSLYSPILMSFQAQQMTYKHYGVEDGISQSVIKCSFQDSEGYLWLGTQNGLNKFDGYKFENFFYDPRNQQSISNNWIFDITEDSEGNLWIGTKDGLNCYNKKTGGFTRIPHKLNDSIVADNFVYGITADKKNIYINLPPVLSIYNYQTKSLESFTNNQPYYGALHDIGYPIHKSSDGKIWIGSSDGLSVFDPEEKNFRNYRYEGSDSRSLSNDHITAIFEDQLGNILIGTVDGLNFYNPLSNDFTRFEHDSDQAGSLSSQHIRSILQDSYGIYWVGTNDGGLNRLEGNWDDGNFEFTHFRSGPDHANYIGHDLVYSLLEDRAHNLWIGSLDGLDKVDLKPKKFKSFRKSDDPGSINLLENIIGSVYIDEQERLWVGNWSMGLNIYDPKTDEVAHYTAESEGSRNIPNNHIHVLFEDSKSRVWMGTRNGVSIYNKQKQSFTPVSSYFGIDIAGFFNSNRVYCITEISNGEIWIGTGNGIFTLDPLSKEIRFFRSGAEAPYRINNNLVYSILEDRDGDIWIATLKGLHRFLPKEQRMLHYSHDREKSNTLCDNFTISLCEDYQGDIWIGTSTGVNRYNKRDSFFTYYSTQDGLPSNIFYDIIEDKNHNLWFSTGSGLAMFDSHSHSFKTYSINEGLQGVEFNLKAVYQADNGEVYFGGMEGLISFHPDSLTDNSYVPPLVITSFTKEREGRKEQLNVYTDKFQLSYKDYSFTIEFAALDFTKPYKNRYAYKMEGLRDEWVEVGNRNFVHFTNLPSGKYTFLVKGTNNDGVWNEHPTRIEIIILPPWWRSKLAYAAYIILAIVLVIGFIRLRLRKLEKEKHVLEKRIRERTAVIARQKEKAEESEERMRLQKEKLDELNATKDKFFSILAHDLKNPFASLYSLSQMLDENYDQLDEEDKLTALKRIHHSAELIFNLLENLLTWSKSQSGRLEYNPSNIDLSSLVQENINLHMTPAGKKGIRLVNNVTGDYTSYADHQMINTVLRNLINNAIKFTGTGKDVEVNIREDGDLLELEVKDQGTGISAEDLQKLFRIDVKFKATGTAGEKGTGLGLILCHEFILANKGTIRCESELGKGTSFIFTLPEKSGDS